MEISFAFLIKLAVIFLGCGIAALVSYWVGLEASEIPRLIINFEQEKKKDQILTFDKHEKISSESGFYEISILDIDKIKIFSSHKEMKVVG